MTNIYEINDLIDFLEDQNITIRQFIYCLLLHYDKRHSRIEGTNNISRPLSKLYKYYQNIEKFKKEEIQDLIDKKLLQQTGDKYKPDMLEVTDKFKKKWFGDKYKIDQIIDAYPKRITNFNHPSKPDIPVCVFDDYEALKNRYNSLVKTYKMHNRVLELVKWANENDQINMGIEKFINSKYWEELKKMKEEGSFDNHTVI